MAWRLIIQNKDGVKVKTTVFFSIQDANQAWLALPTIPGNAPVLGKAILQSEDGTLLDATYLPELPVIEKDPY
jgi:hypothetical protein